MGAGNMIEIEIGTVTGYQIGPNRDSTSSVLLLQCIMSEPTDVQTIEYIPAPGEDVNPAVGSNVIVLKIGDAYRFAIAGDDNITPEMLPGEKKIYSISGVAVSAFINLLSTGILELNGNADFAVRFNALKTQFDELKTAFNTHVHSGVTAGASSTGAATPQSAADLTSAQVLTVKLP